MRLLNAASRAVQVRHEVRGQQRGGDVAGAGEADDGAVGVVERLEGEDLVARADEREQGGGDGLGGAGGDDDLGLRVRFQAVEALLVEGDRLAQLQDALAGGVLVGAGGDGGLRGGLDLHRAVLVREALAQVDGAGLEREGGHFLEDRDAEGAVGGEQVGAGRGPLPRGLHRGVHRVPAFSSRPVNLSMVE